MAEMPLPEAEQLALVAGEAAEAGQVVNLTATAGTKSIHGHCCSGHAAGTTVVC